MLALAEKNPSQSTRTPPPTQAQPRGGPDERPYAPPTATKDEREAYMTALTNAFEDDLNTLRTVCTSSKPLPHLFVSPPNPPVLTLVCVFSSSSQTDSSLESDSDVRELVSALQCGVDTMDPLERELLVEMTLGTDAAVVLAPQPPQRVAPTPRPTTATTAPGGRGRGSMRGRGRGGRGGMNEHMRNLVEAGYTQGMRPQAVRTSTRGAHK